MKVNKNQVKRLANKIKVILVTYNVLKLIRDLIGLAFNYLSLIAKRLNWYITIGKKFPWVIINLLMSKSLSFMKKV